MAAKLNATGTATLKDIGKNSPQGDLGVAVKLTAKKTTKGITYLFTATDSTIKNLRKVLGPQLSIAKPLRTDFCVLEGALGYNVDSHALTTSLTANRKAKGKEMELKASWAEMTGHWTFAALLKPHKQHKLTALVNPYTGASTATYAFDWRDWTFTPALNVQKRAPAIAVAKKLPQGNGTVKGTYALQGGLTSLAWTKKPATVSLTTKVQGSKVAHPTLALTLEREYIGLNFRRQPSGGTKVTTFTDSRTGKEVAVKEKPAVPVGQLSAADADVKDRLKRLDAAYEAEFAKLGKRHPNGVESLSYKK